jgi:arylsulfatase A-like enzyme
LRTKSNTGAGYTPRANVTAAHAHTAKRPGNETVDEALRWLGQDQRQPFFLWVHLYDPHTPYAAPRDYAAQFPRTLAGAYDAEIAYADAQLGRILGALESDGRIDRTVIAVLGDHGEMLGEHGELTHGFFVYDAAVRIPAVIVAPGLAPRVVKDQVRIVDVMPTLLELLGPTLGRPRVDTLKGSRHANMKELRPLGGAIRILFAFDPRRMAILLDRADELVNDEGMRATVAALYAHRFRETLHVIRLLESFDIHLAFGIPVLVDNRLAIPADLNYCVRRFLGALHNI